MTHQNLKMLSIVLVVSLSSCAHAFGGKAPKDIKVYSSQPNDSFCKEPWCNGASGAVRVQAKEVKEYSETKNWIMMTSSDFERILEACPRGN